MSIAIRSTFVAFVAGLVALTAVPARAQLQIDTKDGKSNIKIGFLAQPMFENITTPDATDTSKNIFLRRFRLMFGGKLGDKWTYFAETDNPNLGKATVAAGTKDTGTMYLQDAYVSYNASNAFHVDAGMMLLPLGHNHMQSAATLLPVDYGPYSFLESTPMAERVGRDYGAQIRGNPDGHLEYRLGVFQGLRTTDAKNALRVSGRATWFPFASEAGFFYTGTFQGSKRMVAAGASFDKQDDYSMYGVDLFIEEPFNKGEQGVTFQVDWNQLDGGTFVTTLPKQYMMLVEAALHLGKGKVSPFVQYSKHTYDVVTTTAQNQYTFQTGLAVWMNGHNQSLKFSAGKQHTDGANDKTQILVQLQVFVY